MCSSILVHYKIHSHLRYRFICRGWLFVAFVVIFCCSRPHIFRKRILCNVMTLHNTAITTILLTQVTFFMNISTFMRSIVHQFIRQTLNKNRKKKILSVNESDSPENVIDASNIENLLNSLLFPILPTGNGIPVFLKCCPTLNLR